MVVNTGVVNLYKEPSFRSETVTQAVLGEMPEVIDQQGKWFRLQQWDGYESWAYHFYLAKAPGFKDAKAFLTTTDNVTVIRSAPDAYAPGVRDAVFGCKLPVLAEDNDWYQVSLPDGAEGWLRNEPMDLEGDTRHKLVSVARRFLGIPYVWGGKTPKGMDCSGLVQTTFKALGIELPRDAHLQECFGNLPRIQPEKAAPGDLFFFSEDHERITHVTISTGGAEFIHCSGWVKEESLAPDGITYNHLLRQIFTGCRDITPLLHE